MIDSMKRMFSLLSGDIVRFPLRHRLFNFTLILNILVSSISMFENIYMKNHIITIIVTGLNAAIMSFLYYFSRVKLYYALPVWINLAAVLFFITPVVWIYNGGTSGGSQYFIILFFMMIAAFTRGKGRTTLLAGYFMLIMIIIVSEYYHPGLITDYNSRLNRFQDVAFSLFTTIAAVVFVFMIYIYSYEDEHSKVQKYSDEIEIERNRLRENERLMEIELTMARNIQRLFIPQRSPVHFIDFYIKPMTMLGGDFIDFISFRGSNDIGIFISDVSGHGVPAALITAMIKSGLDENRHRVKSTDELMRLLNTSLMNLTDGNFVTCFYGIYRPESRIFEFTNAGHDAPLIICNGRVDEMDSTKRSLPLGILDNDSMMKSGKGYRESRIILEHGCKVLFYTDGLTEAIALTSGKREEPAPSFRSRGLIPLLGRISDLPPGEFISSIISELEEFRGSDSYDDDVCMVCLDIE